MVYWLSETPTGALADHLRDSSGNIPGAGFNLYRAQQPSCAVASPPPGGTPPAVDPDCTEGLYAAWLSIDSPFPLPITNDPSFNKLMCERLAPGEPPISDPPVPGDPGEPGLPGVFPASDDPGLRCWPDGRGYTLATCAPTAVALCEDGGGSCGAASVELPEGATPPAGWPCPATP